MDRKTVLIVDDNEDTRTAAAVLLEGRGYRVLQAGNGAEGIRAARERQPDVILMDMVMPVVNGLEAAECLKGQPETAHIPIIAVTGQKLLRERERLEAICDGYLPKPCSPAILLEEVGRMAPPDQGREARRTSG